MKNNTDCYIIEYFAMSEVNEKITMYDGTIYIKTENNLFKNNDGSPMTQREVFNSIVGKLIKFNDDTSAIIVKRLPRMDMYNELFKRYPKTNNTIEKIYDINRAINNNILELLTNSNDICIKSDLCGRHSHQGINSFNTREVLLYDGIQAYSLTFSIGIPNESDRVVYAKKKLKLNPVLLNKIKQEGMSSTSNKGSSSQFPQVKDNISRKAKKVNENVK